MFKWERKKNERAGSLSITSESNMNAFVNVTTIAKSERKSNEQKRPIWIYFKCWKERERKMRGRSLYQSHQSPIWMHEVSGRPAAYFSESIDGQLKTINRQFSVIDFQLFVNNQLQKFLEKPPWRRKRCDKKSQKGDPL